jgi:hypothetical protein
MPNRMPGAHLVAGTGSSHAALRGAVQATICPSSIQIVSLNLALLIAAACLIGVSCGLPLFLYLERQLAGA